MRVGAYPGTFDPPTVAHVAIAEAARAQCQLDVVDLIVNGAPLGKSDARPVADRVAMLEAVATTRPWMRVKTSEHRLLADIAAGYDVLVLGADKWTQVLDVSFYESAVARDDAIARLPALAIAPRQGLELPNVCTVLDVEAALDEVSSTAARAGALHVVPPEVRPFLET